MFLFRCVKCESNCYIIVAGNWSSGELIVSAFACSLFSNSRLGGGDDLFAVRLLKELISYGSGTCLHFLLQKPFECESPYHLQN